ncbi:MAG: hypothetical protein A3I00_02130 [Betaproteobacteria bacterium RIFCSPLOWO2_02_FULL_64_12]|nr:MAG: hypothetical protein A3I00_02130 [Betaproteobacteria bacterium RIFCSPLOWO2_02_FULL_64_12]
MNISFAERLRSGERLLGTVVTIPAPEVSEVLAGAGYDWIFIDTEHAPIAMRDAQILMQSAGIPCLIRLADDREATIKMALDTGAVGVVVPQVTSAEQAERIVRCCKYPPLGNRGVGVARAQGYGFDFREYVYSANDDTVVVLQIEHIDAVRAIEDIALVPGVNALFVGPYDLSGSLGRLGEVEHFEVQATIERVKNVCEETGRRLGIFAHNVRAGVRYLEQGYTLVAVGGDAGMLGEAARDALAVLKLAKLPGHAGDLDLGATANEDLQMKGT